MTVAIGEEHDDLSPEAVAAASVAGKCLPGHFVARIRDGLGVQTEALPSAWPFGLVRGQRMAKIAASDAANGKCRLSSVR